jgi:hypothetical protein
VSSSCLVQCPKSNYLIVLRPNSSIECPIGGCSFSFSEQRNFPFPFILFPEPIVSRQIHMFLPTFEERGLKSSRNGMALLHFIPPIIPPSLALQTHSPFLPSYINCSPLLPKSSAPTSSRSVLAYNTRCQFPTPSLPLPPLLFLQQLPCSVQP